MAALHEQLIQMKRALKVCDLAELLNVSREHVYKGVERGTIPAIRLGTTIRFDPATIAEWLEGQATR